MQQIHIPADHFFKRAKGEYQSWRVALAREFIQNSIDAGATEISFSTIKMENGFELNVSDNGRGCNAKTLTDRLLTLGGSFKDSESAVGGFGAAKELLYFAWPDWRIQTQDCLVVGKGGAYSLSSAPAVRGFHARITVPNTYCNRMDLQNAIRFVAEKTETETIITLDGEFISCKLERGPRAAKVFDGFGKLYRNKGKVDPSIHVRINGIPMFQIWSGHRDTIGQIIVELQGKSVDLLTSNRDGFRSYSHQRLISDFIVALDRAGEKVFKDKNQESTLFFNMTPATPIVRPTDTARAFVPDQFKVAPAEHIGYGAVARGPVSIPVGSFGQTTVDAAREPQSPGKTRQRRKLQPPEVNLSGFDFAVRFAGKETPIVRLLSKKKTLKLLRAWSMLVHDISKSAGLKVDAVGITTTENSAECVTSGDRTAILFNPTSQYLGKGVDFEELLSLATHEVAHLSSSNGHDETWSQQELALRRKTFPVQQVLKSQIRHAMRTMSSRSQ